MCLYLPTEDHLDGRESNSGFPPPPLPPRPSPKEAMLTGSAFKEPLKDLHAHGFVLLDDVAEALHLLDCLGHRVELLQGRGHWVVRWKADHIPRSRDKPTGGP